MRPPVSFFAYGSLLVPRVMRAVTGKIFPAVPAVLFGYARYRIAGESFPGIVKEPGSRTEGTLYRGVDPASMDVLDRFEDEFYARIRVTVRDADGNECEADTYAVPPERRSVLSTLPWDRDAFERGDLDAFLETIEGRLAR
jgi:gamma-glutamylcyclotransferase (GGCT)/AIG2-like uncharacterized protein YtfP